MNIIFTGGGTGGHLYPAIAVARALKAKDSNNNILFIGNESGIESSIIPKEGFDIKFVKCSSFSSNPIKLAKGLFKVTSGVFESLSIISKFKPNLIVGSGGYVSAPVTFAGSLKKIPVVLLEQNTISGKTNRFIGKFAKKICISFEDTAGSFPKGKTVFTGNPVRDDIISAKREESRKELNIDRDQFCILVTGASQGAKSINSGIIECLKKWKDKNITIIHLTGEKNWEEIKKATEDLTKDSKIDYRPVAYMNNIASAYASCDLVIARAGATTLAEISDRGIPAILIPYPHAAEDHQRKNAIFFEKNNAAIEIDDDKIQEKLLETVEMLINDRDKLNSMSNACKKLGKPNAVFEILKVLEEIK
ncbi:undecaprenyldiphospho-muramoylpentapeptide beta-N-acetylglucosaminyltransferase [bacterium]|nr:undecaprenyldiphospho-muramoylpentapeptide beta-N-acetylglucosaminyltransferase [bacterium]